MFIAMISMALSNPWNQLRLTSSKPPSEYNRAGAPGARTGSRLHEGAQRLIFALPAATITAGTADDGPRWGYETLIVNPESSRETPEPVVNNELGPFNSTLMTGWIPAAARTIKRPRPGDEIEGLFAG